MLHANDLTDLCNRLSKTVGSVLLDSNGSIDFSQYQSLLASCDGVMLDMKCFDDIVHTKLTGQSNKMVLRNAVYLAAIGKLAEIRTVVVPEVLPNEETVARTAELVADRIPAGTTIPYKLITYRKPGVRGIAGGYREPSDSLMQSLHAMVASYDCFKPIIL